jgi:hypothetical protein
VLENDRRTHQPDRRVRGRRTNPSTCTYENAGSEQKLTGAWSRLVGGTRRVPGQLLGSLDIGIPKTGIIRSVRRVLTADEKPLHWGRILEARIFSACSLPSRTTWAMPLSSGVHGLVREGSARSSCVSEEVAGPESER